MKKNLILLLATFLFFSCTKEGNDTATPPSGSVPDGMIGSTIVIDALGGEIAVPSQNGSVSLTIPPGALTSPTEITVFTPEQTSLNDIRLGFEPDGLEFLEPVRLNFSLSQELFTTYALTGLWNVSELNELVDRGSEEHRWDQLDNIEIDPSGQSISGEMDHFSTGLVLLGVQRVAYMVIDLPGKYLRPGDGLFVMSGNSDFEYDWVPGHVGIVNSVNPDDGTLDGNLEVLESTLNGGVSEDINGVQLNPFLRFKRTSQHVYMGARRPTEPWMTFSDTERESAVEFARNKLGWLYGYLGGIDPNRWTCSELVEAAWDAADRGVFGLGDFFPSPVEMFEKTNYISEITVKVGEEVKIPIYPVVIDKSSNTVTSTGFYIAGNPAANATMLLVGDTPEGSTWTVENTHVYRARVFTWTPKASDAGTTVTVNFQMTGSVDLNIGYSESYNINKHIDIHVRGDRTKITVNPVQMGQTGTLYTHFFPVPIGAELGPNSQDHLIDSATGAYPVNPIFPDQVLDSYDEVWLNPTTMTHYGVRFHISRLDNPFDPPPEGSKAWYYSIDYKVPYYTGN